jgi:hypothetical protein
MSHSKAKRMPVLTREGAGRVRKRRSFADRWRCQPATADQCAVTLASHRQRSGSPSLRVTGRRLLYPRTVYTDLNRLRLLAIVGECQAIAQTVARRLLVFSLMKEDF